MRGKNTSKNSRRRYPKSNKNNKSIKKLIKKHKGGVSSGQDFKGFPSCTIMAQFPLPQNVLSFSRSLQMPSDCVISALQLLNQIDKTTADVMRIIHPGEIDREQIEIIFVYKTNHNYCFHSSTDYQTFVKIIMTLTPGYGVLSGVDGHVFIMAKGIDGNIYYLDPQAKDSPCIAHDYQCEKMIRSHDNKNWWVLFRSDSLLSQEQLNEVVANRERLARNQMTQHEPIAFQGIQQSMNINEHSPMDIDDS